MLDYAHRAHRFAGLQLGSEKFDFELKKLLEELEQNDDYQMHFGTFDELEEYFDFPIKSLDGISNSQELFKDEGILLVTNSEGELILEMRGATSTDTFDKVAYGRVRDKGEKEVHLTPRHMGFSNMSNVAEFSLSFFYFLEITLNRFASADREFYDLHDIDISYLALEDKAPEAEEVVRPILEAITPILENSFFDSERDVPDEVYEEYNNFKRQIARVVNLRVLPEEVFTPEEIIRQAIDGEAIESYRQSGVFTTPNQVIDCVMRQSAIAVEAIVTDSYRDAEKQKIIDEIMTAVCDSVSEDEKDEVLRDSVLSLSETLANFRLGKIAASDLEEAIEKDLQIIKNELEDSSAISHAEEAMYHSLELIEGYSERIKTLGSEAGKIHGIIYNNDYFVEKSDLRHRLPNTETKQAFIDMYREISGEMAKVPMLCTVEDIELRASKANSIAFTSRYRKVVDCIEDIRRVEKELPTLGIKDRSIEADLGEFFDLAKQYVGISQKYEDECHSIRYTMRELKGRVSAYGEKLSHSLDEPDRSVGRVLKTIAEYENHVSGSKRPNAILTNKHLRALQRVDILSDDSASPPKAETYVKF